MLVAGDQALMTVATIVMAGATVLLTIVTGVYAFLTFRMIREIQRAALLAAYAQANTALINIPRDLRDDDVALRNLTDLRRRLERHPGLLLKREQS